MSAFVNIIISPKTTMVLDTRGGRALGIWTSRLSFDIFQNQGVYGRIRKLRIRSVMVSRGRKGILE
jgi:hypothetical protein